MTKEHDPRDYMAEFLAAGKTVTTVPAGQRSDPDNIVMKFVGGRGRPKKPAEPIIEQVLVKPKKAKKSDVQK